MSDGSFWLIFVLLGSAAFVQSATGFGLALVAMAGLPLVMNIRDAATITGILNLFVCVGVILFNFRGFQLHKSLPLMFSICVGIPVGYYGLRTFDEVWVMRFLGVVLITLALAELLPKQNKQVLPGWSGQPICFLGGILGGAFNVGGPPIVAYIYSRDWEKLQMVTTLQTIFLASGLVRNTLMVVEGDTTVPLLRVVLLSIPAVIFGIWLGKKVLDRLPLVWLKRTVFVAVLVIGCLYIWRSR